MAAASVLNQAVMAALSTCKYLQQPRWIASRQAAATGCADDCVNWQFSAELDQERIVLSCRKVQLSLEERDEDERGAQRTQLTMTVSIIDAGWVTCEKQASRQ